MKRSRPDQGARKAKHPRHEPGTGRTQPSKCPLSPQASRPAKRRQGARADGGELPPSFSTPPQPSSPSPSSHVASLTLSTTSSPPLPPPGSRTPPTLCTPKVPPPSPPTVPPPSPPTVPPPSLATSPSLPPASRTPPPHTSPTVPPLSRRSYEAVTEAEFVEASSSLSISVGVGGVVEKNIETATSAAATVTAMTSAEDVGAEITKSSSPSVPDTTSKVDVEGEAEDDSSSVDGTGSDLHADVEAEDDSSGVEEATSDLHVDVEAQDDSSSVAPMVAGDAVAGISVAVLSSQSDAVEYGEATAQSSAVLTTQTVSSAASTVSSGFSSVVEYAEEASLVDRGGVELPPPSDGVAPSVAFDYSSAEEYVAYALLVGSAEGSSPLYASQWLEAPSPPSPPIPLLAAMRLTRRRPWIHWEPVPPVPPPPSEDIELLPALSPQLRTLAASQRDATTRDGAAGRSETPPPVHTPLSSPLPRRRCWSLDLDPRAPTSPPPFVGPPVAWEECESEWAPLIWPTPVPSQTVLSTRAQAEPYNPYLVTEERLRALPVTLDRNLLPGFREWMRSYDDDKAAQVQAMHQNLWEVHHTKGIFVIPSYVALPEDQVRYSFSAYYTYRERNRAVLRAGGGPAMLRLWLSYIYTSDLYLIAGIFTADREE